MSAPVFRSPGTWHALKGCRSIAAQSRLTAARRWRAVDLVPPCLFRYATTVRTITCQLWGKVQQHPAHCLQLQQIYVSVVQDLMDRIQAAQNVPHKNVPEKNNHITVVTEHLIYDQLASGAGGAPTGVPTGTVQSSSLDQQVELAEKGQPYDYEAEAMLAQVTWSTIPSWEESYKLRLVLNNAVIPRLQAWRAIADIEAKSEDEKEKNLALDHLKKIGNEITELCGSLLDSIYSLLRSERDPEAIVFYSTMGGDFGRYMREVASEEHKEAYRFCTLKFYIEGFDQAQYLEASHPLRLTLVLHLSDFYYEDIHLRLQAVNMAQDAVSEASELLEKAPNQESSAIVQQLKDKLSLWTPL